MASLAELAPQIVVALVMIGGAGWLVKLLYQVKTLESQSSVQKEVPVGPQQAADASGPFTAIRDTNNNHNNPFAAIFSRLDEQDTVIASIGQKMKARDDREMALIEQMTQLRIEMRELATDVKWLREQLNSKNKGQQ